MKNNNINNLLILIIFILLFFEPNKSSSVSAVQISLNSVSLSNVTFVAILPISSLTLKLVEPI